MEVGFVGEEVARGDAAQRTVALELLDQQLDPGAVVVEAPVTAISFLLASSSFLASPAPSSSRRWRAEAAGWTACLLLATSCVLLLACVYGTPLFYGGSFIPPTATASIAFVALGTALPARAGRPAWPPGRTEGSAARLPYPLVLVFVLLAAGIVTAGGLYLRSEGRHYRAEAERQLSAVAELKTSELAQWRAERLGDASLFLDNTPFSALVRRVFDDPQDAKAQAQLRTWLAKGQTIGSYDRLFLLDARGAERLTVPEGRAPVSSVIARRVLEVLRTGKVAFQDFYRDEHDQRIYLTLLVPIVDERSRALGVLGLRIDPETYLYPLINRWPVPAQTAETLLVRRDGNDALFLNELKFQKNTALAGRAPLARQDMPAVKAALGQEGIVEGRDYRGVPVIAALRAVPGSPWSLVARMDVAELNAPLRERRLIVVLLVGSMLAAAAAAVGILWREQRVRDFRERYEAEQERSWLHDALARSLTEVYIFDPETLRFHFVSVGARSNIGYTQEELAGLTPLDIEPKFTAESFRAMLEPLRTALQPLHVYETVHRRKDGSEYLAEAHLQLLDVGAATVFLCVVNDITERRRAEVRIQQLTRVYAVLGDINQAIVRMREPRALFAEACRIAVETGGFRMAWVGLLDAQANSVRPVAHAGVTDGYLDELQIVTGDGPRGLGPAASVLREGVHAIFNDIEHDPRMAAWRDAALALGYRASAVFPLTVNGQTLGTFTLYASEPGFFDGEELRLLDEMAMDLSFGMELGRLEAQLRQSQKLEGIGQLAGGIAHDFNNLLTVVLGRCALLQAHLGPDHPRHRDVEIIQLTGARAAEMTRQLLAFSRKQMLQPEPLDFNTVIEGITPILRRLVRENIELVVRPALGLGWVRADRTQVEQILLNLAANASDAMPRGGQLTIETADIDLDETYARQHSGVTPGAYVVLTVTDTGIGMDSATQVHIFEPFFTTKEPGKGTGLGLATVYGIVKQSEGHIAVASEPGHGTTFKIYLPRAAAATRVAARPTSTAVPRGTETILLAEDADDLRDLLREVLETHGYTVLAARRGGDALQVAGRHPAPIHLLVTDVVMPQMGGSELAERLRSERPGLKILFLSGYIDDATVRHDVLEWGTPLLQKPFTPEALTRKVREVLDGPR